MRRLLIGAAGGLLSALCLYSATGSEIIPGKGGIASKVVPAKKPAKASEAATCGDFGTSVHFEPTPSAAARKALKEEKLVFVLHVSGMFENTDFT